MTRFPPRPTMAATTLLAALTLVASPAPLRGQDTSLEEAEEFFRRNCTRCHTIGGGRLTGPDLVGVHQRQERAWLIDFVLDPQGMLDSGDAYAQKLLDESRGVVMPQFAEMDRALAGDLLDLIERESAAEDSEFAKAALPADPFTDSDRTIGGMLFTGRARLRSGAPPCSGCHDLAGLTGWGGGRLASDLTRAWERFGGRAGMAAWLQEPVGDSTTVASGEASPVPVTIAAHRPMETSEILPLSAALEEAARRLPETPARNQLLFSGAGWAAAAVILAVLGLLSLLSRSEDRATVPTHPRWARPALVIGVIALAAFHGLPLVAPGLVGRLVSRPQTLQILETAHLAAGILIICALLALRWPRHGLRTRALGRWIDGIFLGSFTLSVLTGVLVAVLHRWGLAWMAGWLAPALTSRPGAEGGLAATLSALPPLVLLHAALGLLAVVLFPFSRWRSLADPRRLDPRRLRWPRLPRFGRRRRITDDPALTTEESR